MADMYEKAIEGINYYEDFHEGEEFKSRYRIITTTDIDFYSTFIGAHNPLYLDEKFAKKLGFEGRIVPGPLSFIILSGLVSQIGLFDGGIMLDVNTKWKAPVRPGRKICAEAKIVNKRETSRGNRGIVTIRANLKDLITGTECVEAKYVMLYRKRELRQE